MTWQQITAWLTDRGYRQESVRVGEEVWWHPVRFDRVTIRNNDRGSWEVVR